MSCVCVAVFCSVAVVLFSIKNAEITAVELKLSEGVQPFRFFHFTVATTKLFVFIGYAK
jgi:hypothetical protein